MKKKLKNTFKHIENIINRLIITLNTAEQRICKLGDSTIKITKGKKEKSVKETKQNKQIMTNPNQANINPISQQKTEQNSRDM